MKKIKVLMIGPALSMKGGIASVNRTLVESDSISTFDIKYIASYVDGNKFKKIIVALVGLIKMLALLITTNIKIVHIHSASRGSFRRKYLYYILAKIFNKKIVYHMHGGEFMLYYNEVSVLEKKIITNLLNNVDRVIALSSRWKEDLGEISENAIIDIVHNPVNIMPFDIKKVKTNKINVLFMGRLGKGKGTYDLLDIIPNIIKENKNVFFYLCGDGDVEQVKEIIVNKLLESNVFVPGWINTNEKINYFNKSSIYVLPSYNEGLPISILEAMASSLPVIATNVGGIPEAIEHNRNGYLISPGDTKSLENYLVKLIRDEKMRNMFGKENLQKCKQYFDQDIVVNKITYIYTSILNNNIHSVKVKK
ncbi:hypothetical protein IE3_00316 [Bacillus cereus BAG3X2-1]|nr:hypothetical protein IE3_00316 [Bacillus cereus BAG3X2-1]